MTTGKFWWPRHKWGDHKSPLPEGHTPTPRDVLDPHYSFDPKSVRFTFEMNSRKDPREIGDFAAWVAPGLFISERAFELLDTLLADASINYPVKCGDLDYRVVVIRRECDAVDMSKSKFTFWDPAVSGELNKVRYVKSVKLIEGFRTRLQVFRLSGQFSIRQEIVVSDKVKAIYDQHGLTGLKFSPT